MDAQDFGRIIIDEENYSGTTMTQLSCFDMSMVQTVKEKVDELAKVLVPYQLDLETIRGYPGSPSTLLRYFSPTADNWVAYPFFDLYNLAKAIYDNSSLVLVQPEAYDVMNAVEDFIIDSFANSISGFQNGKSGVHIFFPAGDVNYTSGGVTAPAWAYQWWYNPKVFKYMSGNSGNVSLTGAGKIAGGGLDWCGDGAKSPSNLSYENTYSVDNWFELLDKWYDDNTANSGNSYNFYKY
jgi:clostripain